MVLMPQDELIKNCLISKEINNNINTIKPQSQKLYLNNKTPEIKLRKDKDKDKDKDNYNGNDNDHDDDHDNDSDNDNDNDKDNDKDNDNDNDKDNNKDNDNNNNNNNLFKINKNKVNNKKINRDDDSLFSLSLEDSSKILKEIDIEPINSNDIIKLKPANEVYIQLYKQAKNKAKEIKKTAIEAYLEAKEIKDKYNLYDIDDSEDELENLI